MTIIDSKYLTADALTTIAFSQADQNKNGKIDKEEESIFTKALENLGDTDKNGTINEEEAKAYSDTFEHKKGANLPEIIDKELKFSDICNQCKEYIQEVLDNGVRPKINGSSSFFNKFYNTLLGHENLTPPTEMGEGWGLEAEHTDYIYDKLEEAGISADKVDTDDFIDATLGDFNYDLDKNSDGIISPKDAKDLDDGWASKYLNKDENGQPTDTHVLDWMANKYIAKYQEEHNK